MKPLCLSTGTGQSWPHSERFLDIITLGKCEVPYTKSQYSFCTINVFGPRGLI